MSLKKRRSYDDYVYKCLRSIGSCIPVSLPDTGGSFTVPVVGLDWD